MSPELLFTDIRSQTTSPILIAIIIGGGLLLSTFYFLLLRVFTTFMMHLSLIFTALLNACVYAIMSVAFELTMNNSALCGLFAYERLWGMPKSINLMRTTS